MKEKIIKSKGRKLITSGLYSLPKTTKLERAIYYITCEVISLEKDSRLESDEIERDFAKVFLDEYENVLKQLKNFKQMKEGISALFKYINIFYDDDKCIHHYSFKENYGDEYIEPSKGDDEEIQKMIKIMKVYEDDENNQKA